ncbi:MAG TPA: HipA domain-containing protein [Roseomonas sp.]
MRDALFRAAILNWLLGNSDAHLKNFSAVHLPPKSAAGLALPPRLRLAPFYDIVCIGIYPDFNHDLAMRIGPTEAWDSVDRPSWGRLARLACGTRSRRSVTAAIDRIHTDAGRILPVIDDVIASGLVTRQEAKPIRDVVGSRIRHLNGSMGWDIPATTGAAILGCGGWAMS